MTLNDRAREVLMRSTRTIRLIQAAAAAIVVLPAAACQTTRKQPAERPTMQDEADMGQAMIQPLTDLNITRAAIPAPLKSAADAPYGRVQDESCSALAHQVGLLDAALGPDLDSIDKAQDGDAAKLAAGALRSLTTGWIPFRGVLRRLTGAEAHAQAVREAVLAGAVRRAYLKGFGERQGCPPPAAPHRNASPSKAEPAPKP